MSYRTWEDLEDDEAEDAVSKPASMAPAVVEDLMETHPRLAELKREREMLERRMAELSGSISDSPPSLSTVSQVATMAERRTEYARWEQRHEATTIAVREARREVESVNRRWQAMREQAADLRKVKEPIELARKASPKDTEPELRSLDRTTEYVRPNSDGRAELRADKEPAFAFTPKSGLDSQPRDARKDPAFKLDRPKPEIVLRAPKPKAMASYKAENLDARREKARDAAKTTRQHQMRAARVMSDLRILDERLEKARETARVARQEMMMSDDLTGQKPESLYTGLDDQRPTKSKERDSKFDVDRLFESRKRKKDKEPDQQTRRKKSIFEQLDERRKAAADKRREKKKQEGKRR